MNCKKCTPFLRRQTAIGLWPEKFIVLTVLCVLNLIVAVLPSQATARNSYITIATGDSKGVYFQAGNAICRMLHKENVEGRRHNIRCIPATTGGSIENIRKVSAGRLDFGIVQSDVQQHGYAGDKNFEGTELKNLRTVLSLYAEPFHLLTRQQAGIFGWEDLKGKRVNIGSPGSGTRSTFDELLKAYHMEPGYFGRITELTSSEQTHALCKGRIDAFGNTAGVPSASVAMVIRDCGASIISLDTAVVRKLASDKTYFDFLTIPAGTYGNMKSDISTLGVIATIVTTAEIEESVVYELVRAVFENIDHIREINPAFTDLNPQQMACRGRVAPLHKGAQKYFVEQGLDVCP